MTRDIPDAMKDTPAARVFAAFGGASVVADLLNQHRSSVARWNSWDSRGLKGRVPAMVQGRVLDLARERGADLTAEDLIWYGNVK